MNCFQIEEMSSEELSPVGRVSFPLFSVYVIGKYTLEGICCNHDCLA